MTKNYRIEEDDLAGVPEGGCTLHNPHYDFNDEAIPYGVAYWVSLVRRWLEPV